MIKADCNLDTAVIYHVAALYFRINIFQVSNINTSLRFLKSKGFWVSAFDSAAKKDFTENKWDGKNILIFGSEGFGMREHTGKYADFFVKINYISYTRTHYSSL